MLVAQWFMLSRGMVILIVLYSKKKYTEINYNILILYIQLNFTFEHFNGVYIHFITIIIISYQNIFSAPFIIQSME